MISTNLIETTVIKKVKAKAKTKGILDYYKAYVDKQEEHQFLWLMLSILVFSCAIMIPTILLMGFVSDDPVWFISLSVLLFYANIIVHIAEYKSKVYVPVFHLTTAFMVLTPIITFLIKFFAS